MELRFRSGRRGAAWQALGKECVASASADVGKTTNQISPLLQIATTKQKAMAPHSSTLAWKIPWTEGPGGLQSMGLLGVGHD